MASTSGWNWDFLGSLFGGSNNGLTEAGYTVATNALKEAGVANPTPAQIESFGSYMQKNGMLDNSWSKQLGGWGNILSGAGDILNAGMNVYSALQANDQMKRQFNWSKKLAQTNLTNQTNAFNNNLYDKYRARGLFETGNADQYMDQYNKYKATDSL